jgi:hypothetical protein
MKDATMNNDELSQDLNRGIGTPIDLNFHQNATDALKKNGFRT